MVTCIQCRQTLPPGRADRYCSQRCRMQHHRRLKHPPEAHRHWRSQVNFSVPVHFLPDPDLTQPRMKGTICQVPQAWWQAQPELDRLNALKYILLQLEEFTYWEGVKGQKDVDPEGEPGEYLDIGQLYQQALDSVDEHLEKLRQSEGRLGQLLRLHWPHLEESYHTLKRYVREFVLQHQSEEVYETQLSEPFKAYLAGWSLHLGLELEEQSR